MRQKLENDMTHKQYCEAHICPQKIITKKTGIFSTLNSQPKKMKTTQQLKVQLNSKNHIAKRRMKSNSETTKNKSYSSSSLRNLSMNKEQNPKHKPISKAQIYAKNQREKHKIK